MIEYMSLSLSLSPANMVDCYHASLEIHTPVMDDMRNASRAMAHLIVNVYFKLQLISQYNIISSRII